MGKKKLYFIVVTKVGAVVVEGVDYYFVGEMLYIKNEDNEIEAVFREWSHFFISKEKPNFKDFKEKDAG